MRAALYIRLSKETVATVSPETQRTACQRLCEERDWQVVSVYEDIDVSGGSADRPALNKLREEWSGYDAVVFFKLDRLSRSVLDFYQLQQEAEAQGVALVSATEALDLTSPMGRAFVGILAIFAELERATIRARVLAGRETLLRRGRWAGMKRPYGWTPVEHPDGAGQWLALHPEESAVFHQAVEVATATGSIQRAAEVMGCSNQVAGVRLRSVRLIGNLKSNGRVVRDSEGLPVLSNEPLLTEDEYEVLQERIKRPSKRQRRSRLLSGLLSCSSCGQTMPQSGNRERPAYSCRNKACERRISISAEPAEAIVSERFLKSVGRMEIIEVRAREHQQDALERQRLEQTLSELTQELAEGALTANAYATATKALEKRLAALQVTEDEPPELVLTGQRYGEVWHEGSMEERAEMLSTVLETVSVKPGKRGQPVDPSQVALIYRR